jgi:hypothetical protein
MAFVEKFIINRFTEIIFAFSLMWIGLVVYGFIMS